MRRTLALSTSLALVASSIAVYVNLFASYLSSDYSDDSDAVKTNVLRLCSEPKIDLKKNGVFKNVSFQCSGESYDAFGQKLVSLSDHEYNASHEWGRRSLPFPANKSILFYGNSHTRQLVEAFICQYSDLIDYGVVDDGNNQNTGFVRFNKLSNYSTIHWVINSWSAFSSQVWTNGDFMDGLPKPFTRGLDSYDAIILGEINPPRGLSKYVDEMRRQSKIHPAMNLTSAPKTTMLDVANYLDSVHLDNRNDPVATYGRRQLIVGVPMFILKGRAGYEAFRKQESEISSNINKNHHTKYHDIVARVIDSRRHVPYLGECGASKQYEVNTNNSACQNTRAARIKMHKCAGYRGGFADATSWDLTEVLHQELSEI